MDGNMFTTIGLCETFGPKKLALIGAGIGAVGGAIYGWLLSKKTYVSTEKKILYIIGGGLAGGGLVGISAYFTCKGIKYGIPVRQK